MEHVTVPQADIKLALSDIERIAPELERRDNLGAAQLLWKCASIIYRLSAPPGSVVPTEAVAEELRGPGIDAWNSMRDGDGGNEAEWIERSKQNAAKHAASEDAFLRTVEAVDAERQAIAQRAREIAGNYPQSSDGRNTFLMLADWIDARRASPPSPPRDEIVEALRRCLNYIENTESEFGDELECGKAARLALSKMEAQS